MAISVATLITQTRLASGLRNNQLFSDSQIATLLTDGYHDLRDRLVVRFAHWFRATHDFTLAGGTGGNVLDLADVPLLEMVQGLDWLDASGNPVTINEIPSFANRNAGASWPFGGGQSFNGFTGRGYMVDGDSFFVLPAQNSAGNYRLIYTPMAETIALPEARSFDVTANDIDQPFGWVFNSGNFVASEIGSVLTPTFTQVTRQFAVDPGDFDPTPNHWNFVNGAFVAGDVGGTITPDFDAPNTVFNVTYTITAVVSSTFIAVTPDPQAFGSFTGPAAGTATVSAQSNTAFNVPYEITDVLGGQQIEVTPDPQSLGTFQTPPTGTVSVDVPAPGTIAALPQPLTPWNKYLILYASLAIRASRQQQAQDLELQFQQITARIVAVTKQRSEGVRQAPIVRGWGGSGFGGGWGP